MQEIKITSAHYISDYKLEINFDDNTRKIVDFASFIDNSQHPDIKKYQEKKRFKNFSLDYGDLHWNDYELAFPIYDLYLGKI
jgi:hypothetical protein